MTEMKLRDYLKKDFEQPRGQKILVPVVLSDSKGLLHVSNHTYRRILPSSLSLPLMFSFNHVILFSIVAPALHHHTILHSTVLLITLLPFYV
jgi:hypothetical protein